jgi:hypothetical protein
MEDGSIFAFINFKQAVGLGHVAWGYQIADDHFRYGSADHLWRHDWWDLPSWLRYMDVKPGGDIDWWCEEGKRSEMLQAMKTGYGKDGRRHIFYHSFKELKLPSISVQNAITCTSEIEKQGWHVVNQNCVQQAHLIFSSYSKENNMPDPFADPLNMVPKTWFARIPAEEFSL